MGQVKKITWHNTAMLDTGNWWCHLEGSQTINSVDYDDTDEFWIGFNEDNNKINYSFTCYEGMCLYIFDEFYSIENIGNKYDMMVQVNAIKWLNIMIDEGILGLPMETE